MALPPDTQKVFDYLKELLADGKELNLSIDEIKKKAKTPKIPNATVSALIKREQKKGNFKNLTIKKFARGAEAGVSKRDADYKNNKKFRDFYNKTYKTPWDEIDQKTSLKDNSYKAFLKDKELKKAAKGFTLTGEEMAKKLGLPLETLRTYESKPDENTSTRFIRDNIEKKRTVGVNPTTGRRETVVRYKDPGVNVLKNWDSLISSPKISSAMVDNIKEYDKLFRKKLKDTKKLPDIGEVIQKTSMSTPTTIANTEALYSRLLRGETFRTDIEIAKDAVLGKKIINELAINSTNNARRSAFYNLALKNVDALYPQESGTLEDFKKNFRTELRKVLGLKKTQAVPFSVNEVISLSAGESRGIQPFSVFVDAVETTVNENELRNYQGQFSKKVKKIQELLAGKNPNTVEAKRVAGLLDANRTSLINQLTKKGFTTGQINQLNLPDIKIAETIDPKIYSPATLKRYKEAGLDLSQFAKDKGFYVDVKKAKPFWESNVKNTLVELAKNNTGNVCNIFKGKIAFSADGGRIGFSGGCASEMADALQKDAKGTLQSVNKTDGIIPKAKNAATKFLTALKENPNILRGSLGSKIALGLGTVAAGAGAGALVKQFRNDDPSTYLTNDSQMEGMIISDVEQKGEEVDDNILLDNQFKLELAGAAGLTAPIAKGVYQKARGVGETGPLPGGRGRVMSAIGLNKGVLGKGLWALGAPIVALPSAAGYVAQDIRAGKDAEEIATNPLNYLGAAFMNPGVKALAKAGASRGLLGIASLGLAGTAALPALSIGAGLATLGTLGYQGYKLFTGKDRSDEDFFR